MNIGFIILAPDANMHFVNNTITSIKIDNKESDIICVSPNNIEIDGKANCTNYTGSNTITSLINKGFEKSKSQWNTIIVAGCKVPFGWHQKVTKYILKETDILYSIFMMHNRSGKPYNLKLNFANCSLNGIIINKNIFKKVGNFSNNPLEVSKAFWATDALKYNVTFKGILGNKFI